MIIKGNTVGTTMPRTNYEQTDQKKADYLKGKIILDQKIEEAKQAGTNAQTAAGNAQTSADNAKTAADNAQAAANNAQTTADNALAAAGNAQTAADNAQTAADNAQTTADAKVSKTEVTVTLSADGWVNNTQTVNAAGVTASSLVVVSPDPAADNYTAYAEAGIRCTEQDEGILIFECESVPDIGVFVNVTCFVDGEGGGAGGGGFVANAVLYTEQTLTEEQKAQARANIGVSDEWIEIADITSTEEVHSFYITTDKDGNPFECKRIVGRVTFPSEHSKKTIYVGRGPERWNYPFFGNNMASDGKIFVFDILIVEGKFVKFSQFENGNSGGETLQTDHPGAEMIRYSGDNSNFNSFIVTVNDNSADCFPAGTMVKVWGLKA